MMFTRGQERMPVKDVDVDGDGTAENSILFVINVCVFSFYTITKWQPSCVAPYSRIAELCCLSAHKLGGFFTFPATAKATTTITTTTTFAANEATDETTAYANQLRAFGLPLLAKFR